MKKVFYFALMAIVVTAFSSCKNGGTEKNEKEEHNILYGTEWCYENHYSETKDGMEYICDSKYKFTFTSDSTGVYEFGMEDGTDGDIIAQEVETIDFNYTFNGKDEGEITFSKPLERSFPNEDLSGHEFSLTEGDCIEIIMEEKDTNRLITPMTLKKQIKSEPAK
ncbi:MAG: hypothetical protein K6D59_08255 [Bacteroidales bacterium]|nr:hypothetical protein [Bacteroidales bacterium]